jgi:hypothetical protein
VVDVVLTDGFEAAVLVADDFDGLPEEPPQPVTATAAASAAASVPNLIVCAFPGCALK